MGIACTFSRLQFAFGLHFDPVETTKSDHLLPSQLLYLQTVPMQTHSLIVVPLTHGGPFQSFCRPKAK
ncbi:hypothetical protein Hanom_Chr13g01199761 [Helianthus anomalus]